MGEERFQLIRSLDENDHSIRVVTGGRDRYLPDLEDDTVEGEEENGLQEIATLCVREERIDGTTVKGKKVVPDAYTFGIDYLATIINLWRIF